MKLTTLFAVSVSLILSGFCSLGVQAHPVQENSSGDPRFLQELTILITIGICLMSI